LLGLTGCYAQLQTAGVALGHEEKIGKCRCVVSRFLFLLIAIAVCSFSLPAQAQQHRVTAEGGVGIVGQGAQRIPSGRLGYAYEVVPHMDVTARFRFSHIQTYDSYWLLQRADLTYLDGSVGITLHPIDTDRHRIDLGLSAALRGRWERRAVRAYELGDRDSVKVWYEKRMSTDVGYLLRVGYNYRVSSSFWIGAHMHGYTYREGTSLFLFGLSVDYTL